MRLNKDNFNWHGLDHEKVHAAYGTTEYVGTFCIRDEYVPTAVYYAPNPDRSKGHKNYVLFSKDMVLLRYFVRGMDADEFEAYRTQAAIRCLDCDDVIYSVMRHDYRHCACGNAFIDGGRDYVRSGSKALLRSEFGTVDHLTGEFHTDAPKLKP